MKTLDLEGKAAGEAAKKYHCQCKKCKCSRFDWVPIRLCEYCARGSHEEKREE